MSNLIDRDEAKKIVEDWEAITYNCNTIEESFAMIAEKIDSLPLQQQWGNDKIKELIKKKIQQVNNPWNEWASIYKTNVLQELLSEIDNLPPQSQCIPINEAMNFAYWYREWLSNKDLVPVEEAYEKFKNLPSNN